MGLFRAKRTKNYVKWYLELWLITQITFQRFMLKRKLKSGKVGLGRVKRGKMGPNGAKQGKTGPNGAKGANGAKQSQTGPNGADFFTRRNILWDGNIMFSKACTLTKIGRVMEILSFPRFWSSSTKSSLTFLIIFTGNFFLHHLKAYFCASHLRHDFNILTECWVSPNYP